MSAVCRHTWREPPRRHEATVILPALLRILLQSGPITPDAELLRQLSTIILLLLVGSRAVVGPAVYLAARGRVSGREVWWGLLATLLPLIGGILFGVFGGSKKGEVAGAYNPWVSCPWCRTPRGYSALPCPGCGQFLPVPGLFAPPLPPAAAAQPASGPPPAPQATGPLALPPARNPLPLQPLPGYAPTPRPGYAVVKAPKYRPLDVTGGRVVGAMLFVGLLANMWVTLVLLPIIPGGTRSQAQLDAFTQIPWVFFAILLVQDSILIGVALDQALFRKRLTRSEMGLAITRTPLSVPKQVAIGAVAGVGTFVASAVMLQTLIDTLRLGGFDQGAPAAGLQFRLQSLTDVGFTAASTVVVAPLSEELFFRGYALSGFEKRGQANRGLVITAALFAAIHLNPIAFFPLMVAGLVLGSLRLATGSLVAPIVAHATNNLTVLTLLLFGL